MPGPFGRHCEILAPALLGGKVQCNIELYLCEAPRGAFLTLFEASLAYEKSWKNFVTAVPEVRAVHDHKGMAVPVLAEDANKTARVLGADADRSGIVSHDTSDAGRVLHDWAMRDSAARRGLETFWALAYPGSQLALPPPTGGLDGLKGSDE